MILDIAGAVGLADVEVPLKQPLSNENSVRLRYSHLPDLPLLDAFTAGFTADEENFDIPAVSSIQELVYHLDSLVTGGNRVCYVWYDGAEFEICTGTNGITLSVAFAAVLKMPTTLAANTCYSSSLYESKISLYSHYAVAVKHCRGMWDGSEYDEIIAKVRRDNDVSQAHTHYLRGPVEALEVRILTVKRDGTIAEYTAPEIWSIGIEIV